MPSFLHLLARDLIQKYNGDFENLTVIFPNKRAGLFLADELSRLLDKPVWMPEIITLAEYIGRRTGLRKAEDIALIIKLYKSYTQASGSKERFEDFYFWGNMLLSDFDDIDKYLADAKAVFSNLVSLKELDLKFPYLSQEQIEAIKSFWNSFNPEKYSHEQQEFLKVWDKLYATYAHFKESLFKEKICFEGMGQRRFCEHIEDYPLPEHIIFAGFNALNSCEKKIFSYYRDNDKATFYWDYDLYYTADENYEAGHYIRENLKYFPNELGLEHFNNFRYNGKQIQYISTPSTIGQAKLIPSLVARQKRAEDHDTGIILCDERMLIPALHSIPDEIRKINITMGYPAQNTSIAALLSLLGDLKNYAKKEKNDTYYYYKPVVALLNHKLIKELCPEEIDKITDFINQRNIVYVSEKSLRFNQITQAIFSSDNEKITDYLLRILNLLIQTFQAEEEPYEPIEKEFTFTVYTCIQSLQTLFERENIQPEDKLYLQIINKVIDSTTIPFSGEPLEGLQLMGLMETRMLDFKNLIVLSANEGILPKNSVTSSFIPYNLRVGFKLPTPEHQDALFAYYFYRLLQRAENIKILYTSGAKGINSGEMSRFLYQIKYESGVAIRETNFQNRIAVQDNPAIEIAKNPEILNQLDTWTVSEQTALSPSALNIFLECPLRFYFKYIARIQEKEEIAEELDHRLLGNIFHECSETLYATIPEGKITAEGIDRLLRDEALLEEHIKTSYLNLYDRNTTKLLDSGSNELILNVIKKYLREMLTYDKHLCPFQLVAMEEKFAVPVKIQTPAGQKSVFVGGFIDRIDETVKGIRVIDYKTGADNTTFKSVPSVFDRENTTRNKAAFQTMLYCLMYSHTNPVQKPLIPGIYSTKALFGKDYNYMLKCDKEYIRDFNLHREEFLDHLTSLLEQLYSPDIPFTQTTQEKKCRNCPYNSICRK